MNYPMNTPGRGYLYDSSPVGVVNIIGRVWVGEFDSPFSVMDEVLSNIYIDKKPIIVDFHAEATSEKAALGWYLMEELQLLLERIHMYQLRIVRYYQMELRLYQTLEWSGLKIQY